MDWRILAIVILVIVYLYSGGIEGFKVKLNDIKVDDDTLRKIREILRVVDTVFNEYNITYWADCGTLLGLVRHGNVIPWDDDGDVTIMKKDEMKFKYLAPIFKEKGYGMSKWWGGYKIFPLDGQKTMESENYMFPFVDVFVVDYNYDNTMVKYTKRELKKMWPKEYHLVKHLFPLKRYKFHDFYLWGPNNCEDYLNRAYGEDWKDVAYLQYDHKEGTHFKKIKFRLNDLI